MARIIGGVGTTHVPAIGKAIAERKQQRSLLEAVLLGFDYVHGWLAREKPDVAVVFYNDHGLNFFLDKLPTFAVGAADEYRNEDEGWGIPVSRAVAGDRRLVMAPHQCAGRRRVRRHDVPGHAGRSRLDHPACADVAGRGNWPVKIVPIAINTVQHPLPSLARCLKLGRSIGRAIETYPDDLRGDGGRHRRAVASARRHARRIHQQGFRSPVHGQARGRPGRADALFDP